MATSDLSEAQSWAGEYFGRDGVLAQAKKKAGGLRREGFYRDANMSLVSPYYSAMGHMLARGGVFWIIWRIYAVFYAYRAAIYAAYVFDRRRSHPKAISPAEWSTLLPVLTLPRIGLIADIEDIEYYVRSAVNMPDCAPHDAALMNALLMKKYMNLRDWVKAEILAKAIERTLEKHPEIHAGQKVRLLRDVAEFYILRRPMEKGSVVDGWVQRAEVAATLAGKDQEQKLRAMLAKYGLGL